VQTCPWNAKTFPIIRGPATQRFPGIVVPLLRRARPVAVRIGAARSIMKVFSFSPSGPPGEFSSGAIFDAPAAIHQPRRRSTRRHRATWSRHLMRVISTRVLLGVTVFRPRPFTSAKAHRGRSIVPPRGGPLRTIRTLAAQALPRVSRIFLSRKCSRRIFRELTTTFYQPESLRATLFPRIVYIEKKQPSTRAPTRLR